VDNQALGAKLFGAVFTSDNDDYWPAADFAFFSGLFLHEKNLLLGVCL
jgi:hypothetical protein